jgi:hypothetical protein
LAQKTGHMRCKLHRNTQKEMA